MTLFQQEYRKFERKPQRHKLNNKFSFTMEEVFEGLETVDVDMITTRSSKIIESILNRNFGNYFHRHNGPNQRQYVHKHTGQ